jgi:hypothetical protein
MQRLHARIIAWLHGGKDDMVRRGKRTKVLWGMGHGNDTRKTTGSGERKGDSTSPWGVQWAHYRRERRRSAWNRIVFMALRYHGQTGDAIAHKGRCSPIDNSACHIGSLGRTMRAFYVLSQSGRPARETGPNAIET